MFLPLRAGCGRMESNQRERVDEVVGRLDRHGHGGAEHGLRPLRALEGFGMAPMNEGEDLLHDVVEHDAAAERRLRDPGYTSTLDEPAVLEAHRDRRSPL